MTKTTGAVRPYYTLVTFERGAWLPQFGDFKRSVVEQERIDAYSSDNGYKSKDVRIIAHTLRKNGIEDGSLAVALAKLNP